MGLPVHSGRWCAELAQAQRLADWAARFWKDGHAGRLDECSAVQQIVQDPQEALIQDYVRGRSG